MSDLIDRQVAIEAIARRDTTDGTVKVFGGREVVEIIKSLPSAQPERLTDDDFETIRIHLNAYKEKLCNQQRWGEAEEYQRIIDRFMAFASAQTEIEERKEESAQNVPKEDLISRKAAIDALIRKIRPHNNGDGTITMCVMSEELVRKTLDDLPSAQPEIVRCKECKYWKDSDGVYRRGFDAESKCPLNLKKVYEGTFYCGMAERRTDEE